MKITTVFKRAFRYETGDLVWTPFGPGTLVQDCGQDEYDHYYGVVFDDEVRMKYRLEDKVHRIGSFELRGIIRKANHGLVEID